MPVIVVGADSALGPAIIESLATRDGEIRAFVSDVEVLDELRARGVKAAVGDVSDGTHVGGAALNAFVAVLIAESGMDERERAFADTPEALHNQWADGLADAGVTRVIWVGNPPVPDVIARAVKESAVVDVGDRSSEEIADEVARLDEAAEI